MLAVHSASSARAFPTDARPPPSSPGPSSTPTQPVASSSRPASPVTPVPSLYGKALRESLGLSQDIEFVQYDGPSGTLGSGLEGKFKPINDSDMEISSDAAPSSPLRGKGRATEADGDAEQAPPSSPLRATPTPRPIASFSAVAGPSTPSRRPSASIPRDLHPDPISTRWPAGHAIGRGLSNVGNTCFLNSVTQCLLHTPPLLQMLQAHDRCPIKAFCMVCTMKQVANISFNGQRGYFNPKRINANLRFFAKEMYPGRQEDAHEFLRLLIDSMQKTCLYELPPELRKNHALAETSWVHKIFGGKTRSRVTCKSCGHNSDTFEACLDLSLDLPPKVSSLEQALKAFVSVEQLGGEGKDRYKCEKCKQHVDAQKQFTIHSAPQVLTVHLKRFTPNGRKMSSPIGYKEVLNLQPYVSAGELGAKYTLYGVICHAGSGPHHGHYFAFIRSSSGKWHEMNDEDVSSGMSSPPLSHKSAYILFYIQDPQAKLPATLSWYNRRRVESDDEEEEGPAPPPPEDIVMGGPDVAAAAAREQEKMNVQSLALSEKIAAAMKNPTSNITLKPASVPPPAPLKKQPVKAIVDYSDQDEEEDIGEKVSEFGERAEKPENSFIGPKIPEGTRLQPQRPLAQSGATSLIDKVSLDEPIKASSFYGSASKKRNSPATSSDDTSSNKKTKYNPRQAYSGLGMDSLHAKKDADGAMARKPGGVKNAMKPKRRSLM